MDQRTPGDRGQAARVPDFLSGSLRGRRILVTGGQGFLGSHLVAALLARGAGVRVLEPRSRQRRLDCEVVQGALDDGALLDRLLGDVDSVVHLACALAGQRAREGAASAPADDGTGELARRAAHAGIERLVFASSGGTVYGNADELPINERHPLRPLCSYGADKAAKEGRLLALGADGLRPVILRIGNQYGVGQSDAASELGVVGVFADRLLRRLPLEVWGDLDSTRDYVHVDDVVDAFLRALAAPPRPRVLNIGSGEGTSLRALVELLADLTGRRPRLVRRAPRPYAVTHNVLAVGQAAAELGWRCRIPLAEGAARVVDELREHQ